MLLAGIQRLCFCCRKSKAKGTGFPVSPACFWREQKHAGMTSEKLESSFSLWFYRKALPAKAGFQLSLE
jgi:hypothetical protein